MPRKNLFLCGNFSYRVYIPIEGHQSATRRRLATLSSLPQKSALFLCGALSYCTYVPIERHQATTRAVDSLHCQVCLGKEPCVCTALFRIVQYDIYPRALMMCTTVTARCFTYALQTCYIAKSALEKSHVFVRLFFIVQISYISESTDDMYNSDIDVFHIRPVDSLHCQICLGKEPCVCAALFHIIRYHIYPREGGFDMTSCSPLR